MIGCYIPVPKKMVTLEMQNGKKVSFMSNDISKAVDYCKSVLRRSAMAYGVLKDTCSGDVLTMVENA